jgi:ATP-dependent RNA helicase RhlE
MLDMGFMPDVQRIVDMLPSRRQSVFLSATMPAPIERLASTLLHEHVTVMVTPPSRTADRVKQTVMFVSRDNKRKLLDKLLEDPSRSRVLVFVRTKHGADRLFKSLMHSGVAAEGIHGGRSQNARQRVLNAFRDGQVRVLVATDIAARGIDIDDISHVINFDVPLEAEAYVHRIGRTARAGASGESITLCDGEEYKYLEEIQKTIGMNIPIDRDHPFHSSDAEDEELRHYRTPSRKKSSRPNHRGSKSTKHSAPKSKTANSKSDKPRSESRGQKSTPESVRDTAGEPKSGTQRRRSISGKVRKVKPRSTSGTSRGFPKRSRPKSKRR